eukprot:1144702-Pelagomonas_calceolata.AAC.1
MKVFPARLALHQQRLQHATQQQESSTEKTAQPKLRGMARERTRQVICQERFPRSRLTMRCSDSRAHPEEAKQQQGSGNTQRRGSGNL